LKSIHILFSLSIVVATLSACQTAGVDSVSLEDSLKGVGVALPARDSFYAYKDRIPKYHRDIESTKDCGKALDKNLTEWVRDRVDAFKSDIIENTDYSDYTVRANAEQIFNEGLPVHAAAFLNEVVQWQKRNGSGKKSSYFFAATYYAAYGELNLANKYLSKASSGSYKRCYKSIAYWTNRAEAYVFLAEGENKAALEAGLEAVKYLNAARNDKGDCHKFYNEWRLDELYVLISKAYFQLGDDNNAESFARKAVGIWRPGRTVFSRTGLQILGQIKSRQGRYQDALSYALMAKRAQRKQCIVLTAPERVEVNRDLAIAMMALNDFNSAYNVMQEIEENLKTEPVLWNNLFASSVDRGVILRETHHQDEATEVFRQAVARLTDQFGENHFFTTEARMLLDQSEDVKSLNEMTKSLGNLLVLWQKRARQHSVDQKSQSIRLKWIVESYLSKVFENVANEETLGVAFEIAETLRSGQVQQALIQSALRRLAPDIETRDMIRRQQDMIKKLAVVRQLRHQGGAYDAVGVETMAGLTQKIESIEATIINLTNSVRSAIPDYDNIVSSKSFKLSQVITAMEPDEAIISLVSGRHESYLWVITADGRISARKIAKTKEDWNEDVLVIRENLEVTGGRLSNMSTFDTDAAYKLYSDLLLPQEDHWSTAKHLIFVFDNDLATITMGMILRSDVASIPTDSLKFDGLRSLPWLIKTHATSLVPSVASLTLLRQGKKSKTTRNAFLGFGDPVFNKMDAATRIASIKVTDNSQSRGGDTISLRAISTTRSLNKAGFDRLKRLPGTADEILAIAGIVGSDPTRDIFLGRRATEATVRELNASGALRNYRILSFATHGLVPGDLDGLLSPALALSAPLDGPKGDWDDGLLTADEIMELDLDADWAILSACNTAASQSSSTEAFSGLGQAFFYAGAKALLLSNWPVFDDSTRLLMVELFKHESASSNRAQALRLAMLKLIDHGKFEIDGDAIFSYAHPLFWAPFTLVGDGGK